MPESSEKGFVVQRKVNSNGKWTTLATLPANTTKYQDATAQKHKSYYYRVYAFNSAGNSPYSNVAQVST